MRIARFAKGAADEIQAKGMSTFRADVAKAAPELAPVVVTLKDWDQVKLLSVSLTTVKRVTSDPVPAVVGIATIGGPECGISFGTL